MSKTSLLNEEKKRIRQEILRKRAALDSEYIERYSKLLCEKLMNTPEYKCCSSICLYMPIKNEIDVRHILENAWACGKKVYLPKILQGDDGLYMDFYQYDKATPLIEGPYNILEPDSDDALVPDKDTLIIMPGAVFSKDRVRIGYGGGYYDRYLSHNPVCKTMAVAYDFQVLDKLVCDVHDVRPQKVLYI